MIVDRAAGLIGTACDHIGPEARADLAALSVAVVRSRVSSMSNIPGHSQVAVHVREKRSLNLH